MYSYIRGVLAEVETDHIVIDVNDEGINKGEQVKVHLLG